MPLHDANGSIEVWVPWNRDATGELRPPEEIIPITSTPPKEPDIVEFPWWLNAE